MNSKHLTNEEKLDEIFKMTEENNYILRGLRRDQNVANVFRILYWLIIIASLGGAYFFVKPILAAFAGNGTGVTDSFNEIKTQLPEAKIWQQVLSNLKKEKDDGTSESSSTSTQ